MILVGNPGIEFYCGEFSCILNDNFNIILYSDLTFIGADKVCKDLGFVVPTNYISFIKTLNENYDLNTDVKRIFRFKNDNDAELLKSYIKKSVKNQNFKIIKELKI